MVIMGKAKTPSKPKKDQAITIISKSLSKGKS